MDSTNILPQISPSQADKEVVANELFAAASVAMAFAYDASTSGGLVWGYLGARYGGTSIASGTTTLGASTTTYMVVNRSTGAVSFTTSTTNWNDTATYARAYKIVTGASSVSSYEDHRLGSGGLIASGGASGAITTSGLTMSTARLLGRTTASSGAIEELTAGTGLSLSAGSLAVDTSTIATKAYADALVAGLSWKQAVRAATTVAGTLATSFENGDTVDGVTLATGDRILIKNQATASENGIYVVAASGAPARASDADSGAELVNASVYVSEGTTNADTQWTCTTNAPITLGSTSLAFAQLTSGGGSNTFTTIQVSGQSDVVADSTSDTLTLVAGTNITITTNAGTDTITIAASGGGSTQGKQSIPVMAAAMSPSSSGGCAALTVLATSANQPDLQTLDFDPSTEEYAQFAIPMPKKWNEGTITAKFIWSHAATTTNFGVVWGIQAVAVSDNDPIAVAYGTAQTVTDTGGTTNNLYQSAETPAMTVAGTPAAEDVVFFRVYRKAADASDTMAIDARLHAVVLYITTDADTDA